MYSKLLQKILENKNNLNVIHEKNTNFGYVYKNDDEKYVNMKLNDIVNTSMKKLRDNLLQINNEIKNNTQDMDGITKYNENKITKKYSDFQEKSQIKNLVTVKFSEIFSNKINESLEISDDKSIS